MDDVGVPLKESDVDSKPDPLPWPEPQEIRVSHARERATALRWRQSPHHARALTALLVRQHPMSSLRGIPHNPMQCAGELGLAPLLHNAAWSGNLAMVRSLVARWGQRAL